MVTMSLDVHKDIIYSHTHKNTSHACTHKNIIHTHGHTHAHTLILTHTLTQHTRRWRQCGCPIHLRQLVILQPWYCQGGCVSSVGCGCVCCRTHMVFLCVVHHAIQLAGHPCTQHTHHHILYHPHSTSTLTTNTLTTNTLTTNTLTTNTLIDLAKHDSTGMHQCSVWRPTWACGGVPNVATGKYHRQQGALGTQCAPAPVIISSTTDCWLSMHSVPASISFLTRPMFFNKNPEAFCVVVQHICTRRWQPHKGCFCNHTLAFFLLHCAHCHVVSKW